MNRGTPGASGIGARGKWRASARHRSRTSFPTVFFVVFHLFCGSRFIYFWVFFLFCEIGRLPTRNLRSDIVDEA